jgi:predicted nucleotidyltransferase
MTQQEVLQILLRFQQQKQEEYKIVKIGVFGSVARNHFSEQSDVDVVVELTRPTLFTLVGIKHELEEVLHRPVDVVHYRNNMNPDLKERIDREAVYV